MTHTIKHLSFGRHVPGGRPTFVPRALRETWSRVPADMGGRYARTKASRVDDTSLFVSDAPFTVHEHHLHVVGRTFEPLEGGPDRAVRLYEYTFNSNRFALEPPSTISSDDSRVDGASIKFSFDISPMRVVVRETKKPFLDWCLGVCALIGGVYTCSGLLTAALENGAGAVKRRSGKAREQNVHALNKKTRAGRRARLKKTHESVTSLTIRARRKRPSAVCGV